MAAAADDDAVVENCVLFVVVVIARSIICGLCRVVAFDSNIP